MKSTKSQALQTVLTIIADSGFILKESRKKDLERHFLEESFGHFYFEFENSIWGGSVCIHFPALEKWNKEDVILNWGSTYRSLAQAVTTVALYQKAINLAANLQAFIDETTIIEETKEIEKG